MVFYLFIFSCPMKTKSFGMRACFHLMVQNETKAYICCIFLFFIFFVIWHRHTKFSHMCAKWSKWLILLQSLRWLSHSHVKCSHDNAKWSKGIKFLQLSLSVSLNHAKISHDHANWDRDSFFTFSKL